MEHRRRRRSGAGGVRRPGVLPELVEAQSENGDERRIPAPHHRRRPLLGARARVGVVLHHGHLAVLHARVDPASALLVFAAVAAVCARTRRRGGRSPGNGGRRRAAGDLQRPPPTPAERPIPSCWPGSRPSSPISPTRCCGASRRGRPPAQCCPTPPRRASSSPATTAPGGISSRCGPASTPTSRCAGWRSSACDNSSTWPRGVLRLRDLHAGRRHRGGDQPVSHGGLTGLARY